jgi:hypothetical protein
VYAKEGFRRLGFLDRLGGKNFNSPGTLVYQQMPVPFINILAKSL